MTTSKKCDDINQIFNTSKRPNIPSHGQIPKWLDDITGTVVQNSNGESTADDSDRFFHLVDLSRLKDGSDIPSRIFSGDVTLEKPNTRPKENSPKFGRRASLSSQIYARQTPRHLKLSKFDYIVPQLEGNHDFASLHKEMKQTDLEKSWRSLNSFAKTHKGRLDSAKNDFFYSSYGNASTEFEMGDCYSPFLLENKTPIRSRSELSHYVPFYVYSNIQKATESCMFNNRGLASKSKSSEDIYDFNAKNSIERQLSEYKLRVNQENLLREKIINELLTENERITERLKQRSYKKKSEAELPSYNQMRFTQSNGDSDFVIPELPTGRVLKIHIFSTWGDKHYVGLNGVELFGDEGNVISVQKIEASPADVNVLPENCNDPRVVQNLLDGINRTQDDVHLWLTPFEKGLSHSVTITFTYHTAIAMMRIWNYNKSRIHSYRGVRHAVITLDDIPIFKGEIAKACGGMLGGVDAFGDTILFTTDENILESISKNDLSFSTLSTTSRPELPSTMERPPTVATMESRPYTGMPLMKNSYTEPTSRDQILLGGNRIDIILLANWGYTNVIGLTGLEIVGISEDIIEITEENIQCNTMSKNSSLESLINGVRIWNYNGSPEYTYAGVQAIKILLDGKHLMNPIRKDEVFLLRRAPGNAHYDFVQDLRFTDSVDAGDYSNSQPLNTSFHSLSLYKNEMPEGFVFQFIIFSTWGDQYYCGLNEIEIYDEHGDKITLEEQNICAYPESINVLPNVSGDIRTPDKLIDGVYFDTDGAHSWLAPIVPECLNRIYIVLDTPTTISLVKIWNYSKTPSRGVKEFGVLVDDLLIYNGILEKYVKRNGFPSYRSIVFTNDKKTLEQEIHTYIRQSSGKQEVILLDDNRTATVGSLPNPDQTLRPFTSVSPFDKSYTTQ
ncbi:protein KIAA0556-like isoform X2 [Photinus pyralis]|uniref:protein KIAA0556-like isoform X2 n=1 Tax=Photinus pyralis TaxID=7054 RepID=UPI0012671EEC|nr:protein KIAA0556-like isoform X2 [Photinus pyralis]